jgi:hypothetical protein
LIPYSKQSISIIDAIRVARQVKFRSLTQGTQIKEFENSVASYVGSKYAVAVSSATAGLHLAHLAIGHPVGSNVATSPISFVASANTIIYAGHTPFFVDIDFDSGSMSVDKLIDLINQQQTGDFIVNALSRDYNISMEEAIVKFNGMLSIYQANKEMARSANRIFRIKNNPGFPIEIYKKERTVEVEISNINNIYYIEPLTIFVDKFIK